MRRTVTEILSSGGDASELPFDVGDFLQVKSGIEAFVSKYKRLDVLVLNAGISHFGLLDDVSEEEYEAVMRTNLKGAYNCVKAAAPYMTGAGKGSIVAGFFRMGGNGRFLRRLLTPLPKRESSDWSRLLPRNTLWRECAVNCASSRLCRHSGMNDRLSEKEGGDVRSRFR